MRKKHFIIALAILVLTAFAPIPSVAARIETLENSPTGELGDPGLVASSATGSSWTIAKAVLPDYTIRRTVPEVRIQFTVADGRNRLLQSLSKEDFRVLDNRLSIQRISSFSRQDDLPLRAGILLDASDSLEKSRSRERLAAQYFFSNVLRPDTDRASLLGFSNDVRVWQRSTSNREELTGALSRIQQKGYATYLFDSVIRACADQFSTTHDGDASQRVLVIISDGMDTGSLHSMNEAIAMALRREVQIFAVSLHSRKLPSEGDVVLQDLTEATGGALFVANSEKDFPAIFAAMAQQMRTQYALSYQPTYQTDGFHAVKIEVAGSKDLHVHARAGYFIEASQN